MKINFDFYSKTPCDDISPEFNFQSSSFESLEVGYVKNRPSVHFTEVSANLTQNRFENKEPCRPEVHKSGGSSDHYVREHAHFKFKVLVEPKRKFFVREIVDLFHQAKFLLGAISGLCAFYALIAFTYLGPKFQEYTARRIIYRQKCQELRDIALK
jgi:hypothetical protein